MKPFFRSFFVFILFISAAQAQKYTMASFGEVDSLSYASQPKLALALIEKINTQARVEKNAPMLIKSVIYRMLFQSYLTEDAFNKILVDLKKDIHLAKQPEKSILQSLLAETYWKYYLQNSYRISNRTDVQGDVNEDIRTWSPQKLSDEIINQLLISVSQENLLQQTPTELFDKILIGDKHNRPYRKTVYDVLVHKAIDIFSNTQLNLSKPENDEINLSDAIWMAPPAEFLNLKINQSDSSLTATTLKLFKALFMFNSTTKNIAAQADIELKRLKFIYQRSYNIDKGKYYTDALAALAKQYSDSEIYADILYEHANLLRNAPLSTDTSKLNLIKAFDLASLAIKTYPKSIGAQNAAHLISQLKQVTLDVKFNYQILPDKPTQIHFTYKNIDTVYLRLYKLSAERENYFDNESNFRSLIEKSVVFKKWFVVLPKAVDYQTHTLIDKIDGLPLGNYILILQNKKDGEAKIKYTYCNFRSTNIAVINRIAANGSLNYFVSNSTTGKSLNNAKIEQKRDRFASGLTLTTLCTNELGFSTTNQTLNVSKAIVSYKQDTLLVNLNTYRDNYKPNPIRIVLFTDRPIYRPGQTVYYKGLILKSENNKNNILANESVDLTFKDVNSKEIEKIKVTSNEFGTFQGFFSIPTGKLNGQMQLSTLYGSVQVQVEEYKRPSFEVNFDPSNQNYKLTDSVSVKGSVISYAGYSISSSVVKYTVYQKTIPDYTLLRYQPVQPQKQIAFGKIATDKNGNFSLKFLPKTSNPIANYEFDVKVEVTDGTGETISNTKTIKIGPNNISLNADLPDQLFLTANSDSISVIVNNLNNEPIKAKLKTEWLLLKTPDRLTHQNLFKAEKYTLTKSEFIANFPNDDYADESNPVNWPVKKAQFSQEMEIDGRTTLKFNTNDLPEGFYRVKFSATNSQKDTASIVKIVRIYGTQPVTIQSSNEWLVVERGTISPKENAVFRIASLFPNGKAYYEIYYKDAIIEKVGINLSPKQQTIEIKPRADFEDQFAIQFTLIQNGVVYNQLEKINIIDASKALEIKFLTFKNKLQPGEKETWKLQIRSKSGEKQDAELVATLYDASLDKLKKMNWNSSFKTDFNYDTYYWQYHTNIISISHQLWFMRDNANYYSLINRIYEDFNLFGYNYYGSYNSGYRDYLRIVNAANKLKQKLADLQKGKLFYGVVKAVEDGIPIPGVKVSNGLLNAKTDVDGVYQINAKPGDVLTFDYSGYTKKSTLLRKQLRNDISLKSTGNVLNEVVVTAAGANIERREQGYAMSTVIQAKELSPRLVLRCNRSPSFDMGPLSGKVAGINLNTTYNDLISAENVFSKIIPRVNFNETAFFYPQLRTNENGEITIEFTIPQSLTRYKMMGFAHTKDLKTATITNELITQKQLAIAANAPRFFREGDSIVFTAKLNNLSGKKLTGEALLELRDGLTGKLIELIAKDTKSKQPFDLENSGNSTLKWSLLIPKGINAITYKVLAQADSYSDGEENTIPVLPNAILVTESMQLNVRGNSSKSFTMDKLLTSSSSTTLRNHSLTFEFTANPIWYAIQALPYLMEYPYECAEQIFSRFYANSVASSIMNSSPKIKTIFKKWEQLNNGNALLSNLEKNQELKSILLEETPWVRNAEDETARKKRLAVLFDLNRMSYELKSNLQKLQQMQNANGSFSWFKGMNGDRYITQHIVLGMGQLKKMKLIDLKIYPNFDIILNKAIAYLDGKLAEDKTIGYFSLHYLYARSYVQSRSANPKFNETFNRYIKEITGNWRTMDVYQQAQAALILNRVGNRAEALKIINLLKQTAQQNEEMGMYWVNNRSGWLWYQNPVETQSILIEAFNEVTADLKSVEEMKLWLLKNKQTNDWKTTKATTAACYALLMNGYELLAESATPTLLMGNKNITDNASEAGTGYQKITIAAADVKPEMAKIQITNNNKTSAWGALYWQYFEQLDKIKSSASGIKIKKELFLQKQNVKGNLLTPLTASNTLVPGDLVKIRIEIYTDRNMEYMHLKDMRSAGFEPVNVISQYKYQDGLGYYQSTKDASTNFFISYLPKGVYVFEYDLRVSHAGNFSNGITSLQSMYAPEFTTISDGIRVKVKGDK